MKQHNTMMSLILNSFKKLMYAHLFFLVIMSLFRAVFVWYYNPLENISEYTSDVIQAFILGFRLDLTVVGYIQVIPTLLLIALYYIKKERLLQFFNQLFVLYLFVCYVAVSLFLTADFGFYSYFKDHINIIFFGLFDDDTHALMITFWQNYPVVLILSLFVLYVVLIFAVVRKIFKSNNRIIQSFFGLKISFLVFASIFVLNFLAVRGTVGMYPLGKMIPNVSTNEFINKISHNGFRAFTTAYGIRKEYLKRKYDLIEATGFHHNIEKAFEFYSAPQPINKENLLSNITHTTQKVDDKEYNVIVIMVESFGMPILKYQSDEFNILGRLKKHFDEDTLLTNFISAGDGTISSLQSLLLNIPQRPKSFAFSQSIYKQTSFTYSPAFLFNDAGYESTFVYGGDLTWRNLGSFVKYQGYQNIEGKINIYEHLTNKTKSKEEYFHPWGIFDEYLYEHIFNKLKSDKKQFIVALSTNNHPPYNVPNDYERKSLVFNENIKHHLVGDFELAQQRFASYAYAVDQVGAFLDRFKASPYKENTIIAITADNNTIDGIMKYDDNELLNSKNIPLYFYIPESLKKKLQINTEVAGSHKDIFPTLYNMALDNQEYISVGSNLFDASKKHYGFNGSMIVNHENQIEQLQSLETQTKSELLNFYKANLAITQYLIDTYHKEQKGSK
ncbi:LTA synthase family protein [Candidatus Marinarcus aquaticus]|nr:alkaline phosphatase family protein [Candidatus Marinarcus aquaticus]